MDASKDSSSWPNGVRKFKFDVRVRSVMVRWRSLSIPRCCYNFLHMPLLCVFCGYRVGINLGVHNKAEGNLEIKTLLFQFWDQGHFGLIAKWFDFLPLHGHTPLRATTSVHVFYTSIFTLKVYFFYFTHSLLQNTHISSSILSPPLFK